MPYHFGVQVRDSKLGLKMTREHYATVSKKSSLGIPPERRRHRELYEDVENGIMTDEWCAFHRKRCLENFDLSLKYFASLDHDDFDKCIKDFLKCNPEFETVSNLNNYNSISGYYIMVMDEYCQLYIGTTTNIRKRIPKQWRESLPFDRLLFGDVNTSILSVKSFRALDTTRIYAYPTNLIYTLENNFINQFPQKYLCNRLAGGDIAIEGKVAPGDLKFRGLEID